MLKEGFWSPDNVPNTNEEKWDGQDEFLKQLQKKERRALKTTYRGWSNCRVCNRMNGSCEFSLEDVVWPSGFRHYVDDHNHKPTQRFIDFIMRE